MDKTSLREISAKELAERFEKLKKERGPLDWADYKELREQIEERTESRNAKTPYERALLDLSMGRYRGFEPKMSYEAMHKGIVNEPVEPLVDAVRDLYRHRQSRGKAMDGRRKRIAKSYDTFVKKLRKNYTPSEVETRLRYDPIDDSFEVTASYIVPTDGTHPMDADEQFFKAFDDSGLADVFEWIDSGTMLARKGDGFAATRRDITWTEIDTYEID